MNKFIVGIIAGSVMLAFGGEALSQEKLNVWWTKGFYKQEDDALDAVVKKFEAKTGVKVELSRYAVQDIIPKTVSALDAGTVPDLVYGDVFDFQVTSKWAFEGRLEDLSDIIGPLKGKLLPDSIQTILLNNDKTKKRAFYAFPLKQQTMHIQYWADMLSTAGFKESDIPTTWKEYWSFWCDKVQPAYRQKTGTRLYAIGNPMGVDSSDTFFSFLTFMDAYNVKLVDDNGKLRVGEPQVRQGLISAMKDYTDIYTKGCTPPSSTNWKDPDNNVAFHNKTIVMTHNATISIASKWLDDSTNATLTEEQRVQAKKNYSELIRTAGFPKKPDGKPMVYRAAVKTGVIFTNATNKKRAKEFVTFLLQDENLQPYVEGSLGRWYPIMKSATTSPFWQGDVHRAAVHKQFSAGTVPFEFTKNYKFTVLNNENVWGKAMNRVVSEKVPVEKAVDEMIARIKEVAGN